MPAPSMPRGSLPVARTLASTCSGQRAAIIAGRHTPRRVSTESPPSLHRRHFVIDWPAQRVTCPQGRTRTSWTPAYDRRPRVPRALITVKFARADGRACPSRGRCTQPLQGTLTLHPKEQEEAVRAAREREQTPAFTAAYAQREGVESTHAQGLRVCGLRRSRSIGQPKTHLQHILSAAALNLLRIDAWLNGIPLASTRQSSFARLLAHAA